MAAAEYLPEFVCDETPRDVWLAERQKGIGASEGAMVLNISPFGGEWSLAQRKRTAPVELPASELLEAGQYMEGPMIRQFADETGFQCEEVKKLYRSTHPETPFMLATPDGRVQRDDGKKGGLECKLVIYTIDQWEQQGPPDQVLVQVQQQMHTMRDDFCYVLALLAGYKFRHVYVERDDEWLGDVLIPAEKDWWQRFVDDDDFDISLGDPRDAKEILGKMYPEDSGEHVDLEDPSLVQHWRDMELAKQQEKAAKRTKDQHQLALKKAMGKATTATLTNGQKLSLNTTHKSAFSTKASSYRTLRNTK